VKGGTVLVVNGKVNPGYRGGSKSEQRGFSKEAPALQVDDQGAQKRLEGNGLALLEGDIKKL